MVTGWRGSFAPGNGRAGRSLSGLLRANFSHVRRGRTDTN